MLAAGVPAAFGALLTALSRFGSSSFSDVIGPAKRLAAEGFPVSTGLRNQYKFGLADLAERFKTWPASKRLYLPEGRVPEVASLLENQALARTYEWLEQVERNATGDRRSRLAAVSNEFYRGEIAKTIATFSRERDGLLERSDLERFETRIEEPVSLRFGDTTVHKCGFWSQGPVLLQTLAILRNFDLRSLGHNSAEYLHVVTEAIKLAYADREQYYGDPTHIEVPAEALLSSDYGQLRAALIDRQRASSELRPGDPRRGAARLPVEESLLPAPWGRGTVHLDVVDRDGNMALLDAERWVAALV